MRLLLSKFARLGRSRRGSVLILCVVLIVILALIGTAMLSRARIDRAAAVQNANNTEIDLLVEGMRSVAQAVIVADLFDGSVFRPGDGSPFPMPPANSWTAPARATTYDHWDAPALVDPLPAASLPLTAVQNSARNDAWLMPRLPAVPNESALAGPGNRPYWQAITAPLLGNQFDSPFVLTGAAHSGAGITTIGSTTYSQRTSYDTATTVTRLEPDYVSTVNGVSLPVRLPVWTLGIGAAARKYAAGDADGDGIADCGLVKIPVGEINGLTYYAGFRIIDNGSAINVNTALRRDIDYDALSGQVQAYGFFPSQIGLAEILLSRIGTLGTPTEQIVLGTEMDDLNEYRTGRIVGAVAMPGVQLGGSDPTQGPYGENGVEITSFRFDSFGEALSTQLASRLGRPGFNSDSASQIKFQALSADDSGSLAYRFVLANRDASPSKTEELLDTSTYDRAPNRYDPNGAAAPGPPSVAYGRSEYSADQVANWFNDNFNFAAEDVLAPQATFMPRRSLLTTTNALSNLAPGHNMALSPASGVDSAFWFNPNPIPLTTAWPPNAPDDLKMPNYSSVGTAITDFQGYSAARANVNTAYFGELWRAYWNVMVDQTTGTGTPFPPGSDQDDIYIGNRFIQWDFGTPAPKFVPLTDSANERHSQRMFRSSIRDPRPPGGDVIYFSSSQALLLRAALAAVNTETMREVRITLAGEAQPTVQRDLVIGAQVNGNPDALQVEIFGYKPQPFITEVFASTQLEQVLGDPASLQNPNGYVAIELYNPYPFDISIAGWTLAVLDRRPAGLGGTYGIGTTGLNFYYIGPTAGLGGTPVGLPATAVVPAGGFLVLENYNPADPGAAVYRPAQVGTPAGTPVYVPNLHWVIQRLPAPPAPTHGGELVLLRPVDPANPPATLDVYNGVPVDSFDFTGLRSWDIVTAYTSIHYVRSNSDTGNPAQPNWKFVYPGRYDASSNQERRHQGTEQSTFGPDGAGGNRTEDVYTAPSIQLGLADTTATYPTVHTIQLSNADQPGPHPVPGLNPRNQFPFGGFARNGDILNVPFIGAYRIKAMSGTTLYELNAITMDSAFADDTDPDNDPQPGDTGLIPREQVGRFAPLFLGTNGQTSIPEFNDLRPDGSYDHTTTTTAKWHYRWALDLFDYLTVQAPNDDYFPRAVRTGISADPFPAWPAGANSKPQAVKNSEPNATPASPANQLNEEAEPLQGLVNINTAPWKVLAQIPWVPRLAGSTDNFTITIGVDVQATPNGIDDNEEIAKAIARFRDGDIASGTAPRGPFTSTYDLYRVDEFRSLNAALVTAGDPDDAVGDISPFGAGTDGIRYDYEEQYLLLNRVSNLITTRSDTFTVYLVIQGFRQGSYTPEVQRRAAFIVDRTPIHKAGNRDQMNLDPKIIPVASE